MNYNKKTVSDIDVAGKKVLLRCDFNVPQDKETGAITDDKRIRAALPTIRYLLEHNAAVIACSHLGKPKGEWKEKLTLAPVAERLSALLEREVIFAKDIIGPDAQSKAAALQPGQIMLLENLRFDIGEEKNSPEFAKALADLAEVYVSDAFGTVHRAHASTAGVAAYLPAVSGMLIQKELEIMGGALEHPKRPFVAVLGGAKVSDKINVINNLLEKADTIIIGGGMAYTFIKAQGGSIGTSLLEADKVEYAREMLSKAAARGVQLLLPTDTIAAKEFSRDAEPVCVSTMAIPAKTLHSTPGLHRLETWQNRIKGFFDKDEVPAAKFDIDKDAQIAHARIAIATSHVVGKGPGNSIQRDFLSQAFSDFIFAIVIEEMGLIGGIFVVFLYLCLLMRAGRIAQKCERTFPAFLVMGIALLLVSQAILNMMVAVGLFPVTGQPLPLVSKGGTSTLINCAYIGMILSVSRYTAHLEEQKAHDAQIQMQIEAGTAPSEAQIVAEPTAQILNSDAKFEDEHDSSKRG